MSEPITAAVAEPIKEAFRDHRRVFVYAAGLLIATILIFIAVGKHPGQPGTVTTWAPVGHFDATVDRVIEAHRSDAATLVAKGLNLIGSGIITIPLRIAVAIYLLWRRRRRALATWVVTWIVAEVGLTVAKAWFMRARPLNPLVTPTGFSFPSGHAVATASIAVALVLVTLPAGPRRRKWEFVAAGFAFIMALSRVYLDAHWFSDVVAGTLLGTGVALGAAALVTEVRLVWRRRRAGAT
ncbi:MAG: phosphatase PAP2 family protein [Actinomycetota bacterium]|nr:phosphatase PAP2 family protein [Actinomycetota bacterium]